MKEYIEREAVLKAICEDCDKQHPDDKELCPNKFAGCMMYYKVFDIPAADVRPVVYAEDVCDTVKHFCEFKCSHCGGEVVEYYGDDMNYCPICGATLQEQEG